MIWYRVILLSAGAHNLEKSRCARHMLRIYEILTKTSVQNCLFMFNHFHFMSAKGWRILNQGLEQGPSQSKSGLSICRLMYDLCCKEIQVLFQEFRIRNIVNIRNFYNITLTFESQLHLLCFRGGPNFCNHVHQFLHFMQFESIKSGGSYVI